MPGAGGLLDGAGWLAHRGGPGVCRCLEVGFGRRDALFDGGRQLLGSLQQHLGWGEQPLEKLKNFLQRMGLSLNESKTRKIDARKESFNFLGFMIRYDKDIKGRDFCYWNIMPSKKSEQKIRDKVKEYLRTHGHYKAEEIANGLNTIIRGWLNYFSIPGVSYPAMSKRRLRFYLNDRLYRYFNRKSQRKSRLYRQNAFEVLVTKFGLIDPSKFVYPLTRL